MDIQCTNTRLVILKTVPSATDSFGKLKARLIRLETIKTRLIRLETVSNATDLFVNINNLLHSDPSHRKNSEYKCTMNN